MTDFHINPISIIQKNKIKAEHKNRPAGPSSPVPSKINPTVLRADDVISC